jgi:hypothetical protein
LARFEDKELLQQQIDELKKNSVALNESIGCAGGGNCRIDDSRSGCGNSCESIGGEVEFLEIEPAVQSNAELMKVLQEIKAELSKPGIPAAGKLKAAIPLLPGVISYEMELDTEGLLRRVFPTFCNFADKLKK